MSLTEALSGMPLSKTLDDLITSATGYGSFAKYIDCNSALALIGLILFLDIIRDLIDDIPDRRKRDLVDPWLEPPPELAFFVYEGGVQNLEKSLNKSLNILIDKEKKPLDERLCEANMDLRNRFGLSGRIIGTLISNVVGRLKSSDPDEFASLLHASRVGRTKENCDLRHANEIRK